MQSCWWVDCPCFLGCKMNLFRTDFWVVSWQLALDFRWANEEKTGWLIFVGDYPKDSVWEDWGALGKIRGITTPGPLRILHPRKLLKSNSWTAPQNSWMDWTGRRSFRTDFGSLSPLFKGCETVRLGGCTMEGIPLQSPFWVTSGGCCNFRPYFWANSSPKKSYARPSCLAFMKGFKKRDHSNFQDKGGM